RRVSRSWPPARSDPPRAALRRTQQSGATRGSRVFQIGGEQRPEPGCCDSPETEVWLTLLRKSRSLERACPVHKGLAADHAAVAERPNLDGPAIDLYRARPAAAVPADVDYDVVPGLRRFDRFWPELLPHSVTSSGHRPTPE